MEHFYSAFELNHSTIRLIEMLNRLAELSRNGYMKFSELKAGDDRSCIIYDDSEGPSHGSIVLDMCVYNDPFHHDIVSTYDDYVPWTEYTARVRTEYEEDGDMFIDISIPGENLSYVVENGKWYSV